MDNAPRDGDVTPHARETAINRGRFLEAIGRLGNITQASADVGISRMSHQRWKADPRYLEDFRDALEMFKDTLRQEITRRGRDGWEEVVGGHTVRKYSDRMLELQAKALMPEYRDGVRPSDDSGTNVAEMGETWEEQREARKALDRAKATGVVIEP